MDVLLTFLTKSYEVTLIAIVIWGASIAAYTFWYQPAIDSVAAGINRITAELAQGLGTWAEARDRVRLALQAYPHLLSTWGETEHRVFDIPRAGRNKAVMFGAPKDLWNPSELLMRRFNFALAEAVPNILVGVGLFFTFFFLSWALIETTSSLAKTGATAQDTQEAISELLKVAGGKFLTSLAGLSASILWTYESKQSLSSLGKACDDLIETLGGLVSPNGAEEVMSSQHGLIGDGVGLNEELLNEAREQTGTFKRFETDLAITLAGAIKSSFGPQMEAMTAKLVDAIDRLSEKMGNMNQDALKKMMEDFAAMLKQATDSEISQLRNALMELVGKLDGAGIKFEQGASGAGDAINKAGALLVSQVEKISASLALSATNLDTAAGAIKIAMNDLEVTVLQAAESGKKGAVFIDGALEKAGATVRELSAASEGLAETAGALQAVGGSITQVVGGVQELSRDQRAVVQAVRDATPAALAAVERVTGVLNDTATQTSQLMAETKRSMDTTAAALTKTVGSITGGITSYTDQVAELHRKMDNHLGKAVGNFDKGVSELQDAVEELSEVMRERREA